ncbi:MAG: hypothetical protein HZC03_00105 [Candidatus Lloydbacteria bacterium]|nr:hypothetical protein [Candidatus Lloydbacteria bacterium]
MKKLVSVMVAMLFLYIPEMALGDSQPKTDDDWEKMIVSEKLARIESASARIINQEKFLEASYYSYAQLLRAVAESPLGSNTFAHGETEFGIFDITIVTTLREGQLFYIGHIAYQKHIAAPFYDATLVWNVWSNESDNKEFILVIYAAADTVGSVSSVIKFPIEDSLLGNPVFSFTETLNGIHQMTGTAEDENKDGIIDYIRIKENYLNHTKITTAKKLGGSFSGRGILWNEIEICDNDVCKTMKLG